MGTNFTYLTPYDLTPYDLVTYLTPYDLTPYDLVTYLTPYDLVTYLTPYDLVTYLTPYDLTPYDLVTYLTPHDLVTYLTPYDLLSLIPYACLQVSLMLNDKGGVPRLGVPPFGHTECTHGTLNDGVLLTTLFPQALTVARR